MGDRAQIGIRSTDGKHTVYLYSHRDGAGTYADLHRALERGRDRWTDNEYLARIIFCEMVKHDLHGKLGYGIGSDILGDIEHPIPLLNCRDETIIWLERDGTDTGNRETFAHYVDREPGPYREDHEENLP